MHICTNCIQKCTALTGYIPISSNHKDTVILQVCNNTYTQNIHTNIQHSRICLKCEYKYLAFIEIHSTNAEPYVPRHP